MPRLCAIFALLFVAVCQSALAQGDPSGIDFVTIGSPGNAPWQGNGTPGDYSVGRGEVDYSYRIGRYEVTTAQWCEFMNAALDRPVNDRIPGVFAPTQWAAVATTPVNGGQRFTVPVGRDMLPVGGIDWRTCAIFCNWLCNGKSLQRSAFLNGAYDVSTFGYQGSSGIFTDQFTHNPGAAYYIPSLDQWLKAAHYDPNRYAQGQGGWWVSSNSTNGPIPYGPPGVNVRISPPPYGPDPNGPLAQANAGWAFEFPGYDPHSIPLGAYPSTNAWGLFDTAGGTSEWTEEAIYASGVFPIHRLIAGSAWVNGGDDRLYTYGGDFPSIALSDYGFRIAAAVPSPPSCGVVWILAVSSAWRRRRRGGSDEAFSVFARARF
jgi:formylglycine-generating enzyme required for sulfatase activity